MLNLFAREEVVRTKISCRSWW